MTGLSSADDDMRRLVELSEEVTRIAAAPASLSMGLTAVPGSRGTAKTAGTDVSAAPVDRIFHARRARARYLPEGLFAELAGGRGIRGSSSEEVELVARCEIEQADVERLLEPAWTKRRLRKMLKTFADADRGNAGNEQLAPLCPAEAARVTLLAFGRWLADEPLRR